MKKTVAIIGASGEVGFRLVERLSERYRLTCIVRDKNKRSFFRLPDVEVVQVADVSCTDALSEALGGSHAIVNAGYIWFAQELLEAILRSDSDPEHVIFTGSTGVFTKLPSAGAEQKRVAERFIQDNYTMPWTIIRPTMIYGHPEDRNISRLARVLRKTSIMPLIGNGDCMIQPVFIDDLLRAFEHAMFNEEHFYKSYNIGARYPLTNADLFRTVARALDRDVRFINVNPRIILFLLRILKAFRLRPLTHEQVLRFQENKDIDLAPFIEAFGFEPMPFEEGVTQLVGQMGYRG